ncbi:hypothetical protein CALCODRAFT_558942 [Calocera cornea HHB12733]|uniref:F-box domain-containing protein n=1 Tax=Calocera cornea HHB12733 TaxID=1353952 RepID=A0A165CHK5_9BASI|nr:hypothetical protein CALCODRAFT_558942 [Calocera cornea HHB12733]
MIIHASDSIGAPVTTASASENAEASPHSRLPITNGLTPGRTSLLSLPSELLRQIALELRWRSISVPFDPSRDDFTLSAALTRFNVNRFDLCAFLRTARYITHSCETVLYDAVEICMKNRAYGSHESCGGSLPLLLRTLDRRPELASAVKSIALNFDIVADEWEDNSYPRKSARRLFELCLNVHSLYSDALPPNFLVEADIRKLKALATTFRTEIFLPTASAHLGDLENLVLEDVYFNASDAFTRLSLPKLKHLSLLRCLQQGATLLSSAVSLPAESLEELFIHKLDDTSSQHRIFQHARLFGASLKSLTLCGVGLIESINWKTPQIWGLLTSLQVLVISRDRSSKIAPLWEHLPPTLVTLILADLDYEGTPLKCDWTTPMFHLMTRAGAPTHLPYRLSLWDNGPWAAIELADEFNLINGSTMLPAKRTSSRHPHSTYATSTEVAVHFSLNDIHKDLDIQYQRMAW